MTEELSGTEDRARRQQEQAAGFDAIGSRYDEVFPHKDGQVEAVEQLLTHLPNGARVLDIGCGTGIPTARQLVAAGCEVTGIDVSPVMLDLARRNVPEVTYLQRDAVDVDTSLGRFDAVVALLRAADVAETGDCHHASADR
jgi:ubiquinone/menaquinone biosynthesis C-methylase UbiE